MKIQEYKGFEIEYNEGYDEGFKITGSEVIKSKLSEIKKSIDAIKRKEFKKFKVLKIDYRDIREEVEVTSHDGGDYVWIKDSKGRREKVNVECLIKPNQTNLNKLKEMEIVKEERSVLYDKKNEISKSLERIKISEFVKQEKAE